MSFQGPMPVVLRGDARRLPLPDESVDLIVTSPPYFGLRSYTDGGEHYDGQIGAEPTPAEFIAALVGCTREMVRVLKPSGSIFLNLGDKYSQRPGQFGPQGKTGQRADRAQAATYATSQAARRDPQYGVPPKSLLLLPERYRIACVDELGLIARAVVIWQKPNGMPESVTDRVRRSHEDWVHLTKSPKYFAAVDSIREEYVRQPDSLGKLPGSVWEIATQPLRVPAELGIDHFAAFPMEWPRRLILGWSPSGGTVLDPFGGTGTTALVATMLGRHGVSVDLSADYCRLAQWRVNDPKQRERASRPAGRPVRVARARTGEDAHAIQSAVLPRGTEAAGPADMLGEQSVNRSGVPAPAVGQASGLELGVGAEADRLGHEDNVTCGLQATQRVDLVLTLITEADTYEALLALWREHKETWTEGHTSAARDRRAEIERTAA
jgi:site-specific DNA-methyltransferase (cytosine-N4-specific)